MDYPNKKYQLIYADPPWSYNLWNKKEKGRTAESHYQTMDINDIKNIPVKDFSEDNSIILLWATYPCLKEGIELLEHWGFNYKTVAFTWIKMNKNKNTPFVGLGSYTRANAEIVLLGKKGNGLERKNKGVQQIVQSKIREHSRKPDEIKVHIEKLFGDISKLEMFARNQTPGWDSWGNEVEKFTSPLKTFFD